MVVNTVPCKPVVKGNVSGEVLFSRKPLCFLGGVDPATGIIRDPLSDQFGQSVADKICVFPFGKGSSSTALVILELARINKAPKAMVNLRTNTVLLTGPLVCREFYKKLIPVVNVDEAAMDILSGAREVSINCTDGNITIDSRL